MRRTEVLSIGSLVIDSINGKKKVGGAAANVAVNMHRLGGSPSILTALSQEQEACEYHRMLNDMGIKVHELPSRLEKLPHCVIRMGADGKQESIQWFGNGIEELFQSSELDNDLIKSAPSIYLAICETIYAKKVALEMPNDRTLSYNPGGRVFGDIDNFKPVQARANHTFLNEKEYGYLVTEGYVQKPSDLIHRPDQIAVITAGHRDTTLVTNDRTSTFPTETVPAIDETGAGDSFASAFLWARSEGYSVDTCVMIGNLLASFVVQQIGCQVDQRTADGFKSEAKKRGLLR